MGEAEIIRIVKDIFKQDIERLAKAIEGIDAKQDQLLEAQSTHDKRIALLEASQTRSEGDAHLWKREAIRALSYVVFVVLGWLIAKCLGV